MYVFMLSLLVIHDVVGHLCTLYYAPRCDLSVSFLGVMLNLLGMQRAFKIAPDEACLLASPPSFDPSICQVFLALWNGARIIIPRPGMIPSGQLGHVIDLYHVDVVMATPSQIGHVRSNYRPRIVCLGGEPYPQNSPDLNAHVKFNIYGITEMSVWASMCPIPETNSSGAMECSRMFWIGIPFDGTSMLVRNLKLLTVDEARVVISRVYCLDKCGVQQCSHIATFDDVIVNVPDCDWNVLDLVYEGNLCVGGESRLCRILNMNGNEVVNEVGMIDTGDVVYVVLQSNGVRLKFPAIIFVARTDGVSKLRGIRVHPDDVSCAISHFLENLVQVHTVIIDDELVSFIAGSNVNHGLLFKHVLSSFNVTIKIHLLNELPLTINGKIDIRALIKCHQDFNAVCAVTSIDILACKCVRLTRRMMRLISDYVGDAPVIDATSSFRTLGGSSFSSISLSEAIVACLDSEFDSKSAVSAADVIMMLLSDSSVDEIAFNLVHNVLQVPDCGRIVSSAINKSNHAIHQNHNHCTFPMLKCVDFTPFCVSCFLRSGVDQHHDFIVASHGGDVCLVRYLDGDVQCIWKQLLPDRIEGSCAVVVSSDNHCVAIPCYDGIVRLLSLDDGKVLHQVHSGMKFSPMSVVNTSNSVVITCADGLRIVQLDSDHVNCTLLKTYVKIAASAISKLHNGKFISAWTTHDGRCYFSCGDKVSCCHDLGSAVLCSPVWCGGYHDTCNVAYVSVVGRIAIVSVPYDTSEYSVQSISLNLDSNCFYSPIWRSYGSTGVLYVNMTNNIVAIPCDASGHAKVDEMLTFGSVHQASRADLRFVGQVCEDIGGQLVVMDDKARFFKLAGTSKNNPCLVMIHSESNDAFQTSACFSTPSLCTVDNMTIVAIGTRHDYVLFHQLCIV